jgi:hypothetical protein
MLDPKIVAAKIQGSDAGAHGTPAGLDLITPSSQGCSKIFPIF